MTNGYVWAKEIKIIKFNCFLHHKNPLAPLTLSHSGNVKNEITSVSEQNNGNNFIFHPTMTPILVANTTLLLDQCQWQEMHILAPFINKEKQTRRLFSLPGQ